MAACEGDAYCSTWLEHMRTSPGPLAAYERYQRLTEELWKVGHGGVDESGISTELVNCTTVNCLAACELGRDFSCVGKFEWSIAYPTRLRTRIQDYYGNVAPSPWTVRACLPADVDCPNPLATATTDADGFATLELTPSDSPYSEFGGFMLLKGGSDFHEWATIVSRPFVTDDYSPWKLPAKELVDQWFALFEEKFDPSYGYIWVIPGDCRGLAAKGVELLVELATSQGVENCSSCVYTYESDVGLPDVQRKDFSTAGRVGFISYVPARQVILTVRDAGTDQVVARQNVSVAAGRIHFVRIYPASGTELASRGSTG